MLRYVFTVVAVAVSKITATSAVSAAVLVAALSNLICVFDMYLYFVYEKELLNFLINEWQQNIKL